MELGTALENIPALATDKVAANTLDGIEQQTLNNRSIRTNMYPEVIQNVPQRAGGFNFVTIWFFGLSAPTFRLQHLFNLDEEPA